MIELNEKQDCFSLDEKYNYDYIYIYIDLKIVLELI